MLKRKAEYILNNWKHSNDALLITGARQVGKSYLIREFGKANFKHFIEINLYEQKEFIPVLEKSKNAKDLLFRVSAFTTEEMVPNETLIFFDEIQYAKNCDLITLVKFLVEDSQFRYIFSGSMLGVELNNIASWPTGYMRELRMYPLDFEEFLWSVGLKEEVIKYLNDCFLNESEVDSIIHERILDAFYKYLLIGGMPEAVQIFITTNDLKKVNDVQDKIDQFYKKDVVQYANREEKVHLETIYNTIPTELNSKNKRFSLKEIGRGYQIKDIQDDFMWLKKAGVALPTFNISEPKIPLEFSANNRLVKLFHSDVGVLSKLLMETDVHLKLLSKEKDINYGAIFENVAAQELSAHGFDNLYYFNSKKQGEVDFVIEYKGEVLPIEVKSGKDYKIHSALDNLLANENYDIKEAYILCNGNIERKGKRLYLPIYMLMFIKKAESLKAKITLNLSSLEI